jgi:hypothetical protein
LTKFLLNVGFVAVVGQFLIHLAHKAQKQHTAAAVAAKAEQVVPA